MAFNPFHSFRKNQKVFMAGLVLVCMVTFILSSGIGGGGDFFGMLQRLVGGRSGQAEAATLYGNDVSVRDLDLLRQQRLIANTYMSAVFNAALQGRVRELTKDKQFLAQLPPELQQREMSQLMFGDEKARGLWFLANSGSFFGTSVDLESLLDFMIWKHQADRLNIELSDADVQAEIDKLTSNLFSRGDSRLIEADMRRSFPSMTPEFLASALKDEFRVRLARASLEGYETATRAQMPAVGTPDEFWNYYKEQRTEIDVALLTIPTSDFKVPDTPPEEELKDLFNKYKNVEAKPESDKPGFMQPRRLQIQWLSGRTDTPLAEQAGAVELAVLQMTMPQAFSLALLEEYGRQVHNPEFRAPSLTDPNFALAYYPGLDQPENTAATAGQVLGAIATQAPLVSAAVTYQAGPVARGKQWESVIAEQTRQRVGVGLTLMLAGTTPYPPGLAALGLANQLSYAAHLQQTLPVEQVRPRLLARLREKATQAFVTALFAGIQKQIEEKAKKQDGRKELPQYLEEAAKKYSLKTGVMEKPLSQYEIAKDPALEPLNSAFRSTMPANRETDERFAQHFFQGDMRLFGIKHEPELHPQFPQGWNSAPERFLYWPIKDESAYVPGSLDRVRDQVVTAWKQLKARDLAQKAAEELAKEAAATKGDAKELNDLEAKTKRTKLVLRGVAKIKPNLKTLPSAESQPRYQEYTEHRDKITYPPTDFVERLLTLKGQEKGATLILTDRPLANYYVAVLIDQHDPSREMFYWDYKMEAGGSSSDPRFSSRDSLYSRFEAARREAYRKDFIAQLRTQAGLRINEEGRKGFDGRGRSQEQEPD